MKFKVIKTYQYTEELEIEADSEIEAYDIAMATNGDRIFGDSLQDIRVIEKDK